MKSDAPFLSNFSMWMPESNLVMRAVKQLFRLVLLGLVSFLVWKLWTDIVPEMLANVEKWKDNAAVAVNEPLSGILFNELVKRQLIRLNEQNFRIEVAPRDLEVHRALARKLNQQQKDDWPETLNSNESQNNSESFFGLLEAYYSNNRAAAIVRREVGNWNANHELAAIRDSRMDKQALKEKQWLGFGDIVNRWRADIVVDPDGRAVVYSAHSRPNLPVDLYGYMAVSLKHYPAPMGDWLSAASGSVKKVKLRFTSAWLPNDNEEGDFYLDVVGQEVVLKEGASEIRKRLRLCSSYQISPKEQFRRPNPDCADSQAAEGFRLKLRAGEAGKEIVLDVTPLSLFPDQLRGKKITYHHDLCKQSQSVSGDRSTWDCGKQKILAHRGADNILSLCVDDNSEVAKCTLRWSDSEGHRPVRHDEVYLVSADGAKMTDAEGKGRISSLALEMGLAPLLGVSVNDPFGLSAAVYARTRKGKPSNLLMTIDSRVQRAMQDVLHDGLQKKAHKLPDKYAEQRRAVLVFVDVGEFGEISTEGGESGDVLAVVTQPSVTPGASLWNSIALDFWRPQYSSLSPLAWSRTNGATAPGSTFKVITGLNLIKKAAEETRDDGRYLKALRGDPVDAWMNPGLPLPDKHIVATKDLEGIVIPLAAEIKRRGYKDEPCHPSKDARIKWRSQHRKERIYSSRVCNYPGEKIDHAVAKPEISGCPAVRADKVQYGLCEAITASVNSWFVLTALALDGKKAISYKSPQKRASLDNTKESSERGTPGYIELAKHLLPRQGTDLVDSWGGWPTPSIVSRFRVSDDIVIGLDAPGVDPLFTLAQNTIGQDIQASPLAMASLYASIATGCKVSPRVARGGRLFGDTGKGKACEPLFFTEPGKDYLEEKALGLMKQYLWPGLYGVINNHKQGTAKLAFDKDDSKPFRQYVYSKTGTADLEQGLNTTWLTGWVEKEGTGKYGRRVAFACMVTHVTGGEGGTGGTVCGPIVREAIKKLRTIEPLEHRGGF